METNYTVDYFIAKFSAIPEDLWTTFTYGLDDTHCALGHCGMTHDMNHFSLECDALGNILASENVVDINDGLNKKYQQPTPKQRILAALYDIKKMQEPKPIYENISKSLAILPIDETTDLERNYDKIKVLT